MCESVEFVYVCIKENVRMSVCSCVWMHFTCNIVSGSIQGMNGGCTSVRSYTCLLIFLCLFYVFLCLSLLLLCVPNDLGCVCSRFPKGFPHYVLGDIVRITPTSLGEVHLSRLLRHAWLEGRVPILAMLALQAYPGRPTGK